MATPPTATANVDIGKLLLRAVTPEELNELTAQQFIFTGKLKVEDAQRKIDCKKEQRTGSLDCHSRFQ